MADSEILYVIKADNQQAINAFNQLMKTQEGVEKSTRKLTSSTQQGNMLLMSTGRIVQDAPYGLMGMSNNITFLAEQFALAKTQAGGFQGALKGMMTSLMGTGGIIFAISLVTSVLTMMSMKSKETTAEMETFAEVLERAAKGSRELQKELNKVQTEMQNALDPDFLQIIQIMLGGSPTDAVIENMNRGGYVSGANRQRVLNEQKEKNNQLTRIAIQLTKDEGKSINEVVKQEMLRNQDLKFMQKYLEGELDKIPKVSAYYNKYADALEAVNKQLGKTKDVVKEIRDVIDEGGKLIYNNDKLPFDAEMLGNVSYDKFGLNSGDATRRIGAGGAGAAMFSRGYMAQMALVQDLTLSSANVLRSEFSSAWQDIFGEANSLFEKFMMNIAEQLANLAISNIAGSFLNFLFPGAGFVGDLFNKPQVINVNVGNETVERVVVSNVKSAQQKRLL